MPDPQHPAASPADRPTLADLAGASAGLECPRCGCRDFRVRNTVRGQGYIVRYRTCRHCGWVRKTMEN